jgi:flagellin
MSVINTNVKSLVAQNAMTVNNRSLSKAMEQLSTGKRINTAADDAAGLAISSKMTAQIKGLNQAVRNANDGMSLIQTAEGALIETTNMLQRMRELAVQSANDTNTDDDRDALDLEFTQLRAEIDRIGSSTQWNGFDLLKGDAGEAGDGELLFQVGANSEQTIGIEIKDFTVGLTAKSPSITQVNLVGGDDPLDVTKAILTLGDNADFSVAITDATDAEGTLEELQAAINNVSGYENVTLKFEGDVITITDPSAREITISLTDDDDLEIVGSAEIDAGEPSGGELSALLEEDIKTRTAANSANSALDSVLTKINESRATWGAAMNRLIYAGESASTKSINLTAASSQLMDADYAQVTAELARTLILNEAGAAMLSQANQQPMYVLALLR